MRIVSNSARPQAPKVLYVVPTFDWDKSPSGLTSTRHGDGLRVYMDRPWWSSGDGEQLAVVLWRPDAGQIDPVPLVAPHVTMWGIDPVYKSFHEPGVRPVLSSFSRRDASHDSVRALVERPGVFVDVAAHNVGFDATRDLWFCDIIVNHGKSYTPFIRLALARYQHNSVPNAHLSPVVLADFIQLSPTRTASVVPLASLPRGPLKYAVSLTGRSYASVVGRAGPAEARVTVEQKSAGIVDPNLGWNPVGDPTLLTPSSNDINNVTWQGQVNVPRSGGAKRLVFEEFEVLFKGTEFLNRPSGRRLVHTDIINL